MIMFITGTKLDGKSITICIDDISTYEQMKTDDPCSPMGTKFKMKTGDVIRVKNSYLDVHETLLKS